MTYFIIKKDKKEYKTDSKAGAFEMWDCWGRAGVIIEEHIFDTDVNGIEKHYVHTATRASRKTCKDGTIKYHMRWDKCRVED